MHQTRGMGRRQPLPRLQQHRELVSPRVAGPAANVLTERLALEILHHDVRDLRIGRDVVDLHDVGVAQLRDRLGFPAKADERFRGLARQLFDRDAPLELAVPCRPDRAHPPAADQRFDRVAFLGLGRDGGGSGQDRSQGCGRGLLPRCGRKVERVEHPIDRRRVGGHLRRGVAGRRGHVGRHDAQARYHAA